MNTALWIVQVLLALLFGLAGFLKLTWPKAKLAANFKYFERLSPNVIKVIGIVEVLGALGLMLPALTSILSWLTPLAGIGLVLEMVGAVIFHFSHREYPNIVFNVILLALAAFVAYGRFVAVPL